METPAAFLQGSAIAGRIVSLRGMRAARQSNRTALLAAALVAVQACSAQDLDRRVGASTLAATATHRNRTAISRSPPASRARRETAARVCGAVIRRYLLPSPLSYPIMHLTLAVHNVILCETALNFIDLKPPVVCRGVAAHQRPQLPHRRL